MGSCLLRRSQFPPGPRSHKPGRGAIMKTISVMTPCFNEEENVQELYQRVRQAIIAAGPYRYEHIFIDNNSQDRTVEILKEIARHDHNVKIIVNTRNFGHIRSPMHALM